MPCTCDCLCEDGKVESRRKKEREMKDMEGTTEIERKKREL